VRSEDQGLYVPFDRAAFTNRQTYTCPGKHGPVVLFVPIEGKNYTARQLSHMHKLSMMHMRNADLQLGAEVVSVLKHCS